MLWVIRGCPFTRAGIVRIQFYNPDIDVLGENETQNYREDSDEDICNRIPPATASISVGWISVGEEKEEKK